MSSEQASGHGATGERAAVLNVRLHAPDLGATQLAGIARKLSGQTVRVTADPIDAPDGAVLVFERLTSSTFARAAELVAAPQPCVAVGTVTGYATADLVALRRIGVADLLCGGVGDATRAALAARFERLHAVEQLLASPAVAENLVGTAPAWRRTLRKVIEIARYSQASILLTGPTGTGKELLARLIHLLDARPDKRNLVVLDCTTVVPELSGSEFFGHERGAFTNAMCSREGAFALADAGTLFLDEVGELPAALQAELLRVVQDRTYKRVGGNTWQRASFRLVCATNRDLSAERREGRFRADLFYRLVTHVVHVPALAARPGDVDALAEHFLREYLPQIPRPGFDPTVLALLRNREYPGNVRELRQLVAALASRHVGTGPITLGDVSEDELPQAAATATAEPHRSFTGELAETCDEPRRPGGDALLQAGVDEASTGGAYRPLLRSGVRAALAHGEPLQEIKRVVGTLAVEEAIRIVGGNVRLAARKLGVTDRALQLRGCGSRSNSTPQPGVPDMPGVRAT